MSISYRFTLRSGYERQVYNIVCKMLDASNLTRDLLQLNHYSVSSQGLDEELTLSDHDGCSLPPLEIVGFGFKLDSGDKKRLPLCLCRYPVGCSSDLARLQTWFTPRIHFSAGEDLVDIAVSWEIYQVRLEHAVRRHLKLIEILYRIFRDPWIRQRIEVSVYDSCGYSSGLSLKRLCENLVQKGHPIPAKVLNSYILSLPKIIDDYASRGWQGPIFTHRLSGHLPDIEERRGNDVPV